MSSNNVLEEFVLDGLKASPLMKPLFTPQGGGGGGGEKS